MCLAKPAKQVHSVHGCLASLAVNTAVVSEELLIDTNELLSLASLLVQCDELFRCFGGELVVNTTAGTSSTEDADVYIFDLL